MTRRPDPQFSAKIAWTGSRGTGTQTYKGYDRTWEIHTTGDEIIRCSNDPGLGGDPLKPNPEDLLLASLASCHMLWFLHLASAARITVHAYSDEPLGIGETAADGAGRFLRATLRPRIVVDAGTDLALADSIHAEVHRYCFVARSVNFPIACEATYLQAEAPSPGAAAAHDGGGSPALLPSLRG